MKTARTPDKWLKPRKITPEEKKKDNNCSTCIHVSACETKETGKCFKICDNYSDHQVTIKK